MAKKHWKQIMNVLFLILFLLASHYVNMYVENYTKTTLNIFIPSMIWSNLWPIPLAAYFARNRLKTLWKSGKIHVDVGYFIFPVLYLLCYIRPIFTFIIFYIPSYGVVALIAWYNLFYAFYKEEMPCDNDSL